MNQLSLDYHLHTSPHQLSKPAGYKGLYGFHKYWGKKPAETVRFLIQQLSQPNDIILDPFLGSGAIVREALMCGRRLIASDINPAAIELASLIASPPTAAEIQHAFTEVESKVRATIDESYLLMNGMIATHYLWQGNELIRVWVKRGNGKLRLELEPSDIDRAMIEQFCGYRPETLRPLKFFRNSRINSFENMQWSDLFTGRALRNIELLRSAILEIPSMRTRCALLMALTAASGQMSKMVFAIEKRGKSSGSRGNGRVEVGSWVIGFWRPELHFEINVWNCFENKTQTLLRGLKRESMYQQPPRMSERPTDVVEGHAEFSLMNGDAAELLALLPEGSVDLLVTDPPHGDRIPYLELSEIWNAILGKEPRFEQELVVSNAVQRSQTPRQYAEKLRHVFQAVGRVLSPAGQLAVIFNSRFEEEWNALLTSTEAGNFFFCGCFPMAYSAGSVVQDNRSGALKHDYVLIFVPGRGAGQGEVVRDQLKNLPGWTGNLPEVRHR